MKVVIHDEAGDEAADLVSWYGQQNPRAAERLAELFVAAIVQIARQPLSFSPMGGAPASKEVRRARIRGFPIMVIFQVRPEAGLRRRRSPYVP